MLEFREVRFRYDSEELSIIDRLSFTVKKGEFVSVIGPSGCGKSTIFRLVNRLLLPAEGEILINGAPLGGKPSPGSADTCRSRTFCFPGGQWRKMCVFRWRSAEAFRGRRWSG